MADIILWKTFQSAVASHLGLDPDLVLTTTDIYKDLGLDSLGVISLGMKMYSLYKIRLPISATSSIYTLGDMFHAINRYADKQDRSFYS